MVNVMHARGYSLDHFSFSALLSACQRVQQPELAWAVYRCQSGKLLEALPCWLHISRPLVSL